MTQYAVYYRVAEESFAQDRALLHRAYQELATHQPSWLTCETFQLDEDEDVYIFLLDGDQERSAELHDLTGYWAALSDRCHGEPKLAVVSRADIDRLHATRIAFWNPYRRTFALPGAGTER